MLSINAHTQEWQESELVARQESAESFHFEAGAYSGIAICSLFIVGIVAGLLEVHLFKTSPCVGVVAFASGIVAVFALFVLAVFAEIALDIYKNRSVY